MTGFSSSFFFLPVQLVSAPKARGSRVANASPTQRWRRWTSSTLFSPVFFPDQFFAAILVVWLEAHTESPYPSKGGEKSDELPVFFFGVLD